MAKSRKAIEGNSKKCRAHSKSLVDWVYWMVVDILESYEWEIEYRYVYYDKKEKVIDVRKRPVSGARQSRFQYFDACVEPEEGKIFINPESGNKPLCLFHECLEILFADWKDDYFVPKFWGLEERVDPISYLEAATWDKLSRTQKNTIKWYLPKGP